MTTLIVFLPQNSYRLNAYAACIATISDSAVTDSAMT